AAAILEDRWEPYLEVLHAQGEHYALAGTSYGAWLELLGDYRDLMRDDLRGFLQEDPRNSAAMFEIARGMNRFVDLITAQIGDAYLAAKQRVIAEGEERYRAMFERSPQPMWTFDRATLRFL